MTKLTEKYRAKLTAAQLNQEAEYWRLVMYTADTREKQMGALHAANRATWDAQQALGSPVEYWGHRVVIRGARNVRR